MFQLFIISNINVAYYSSSSKFFGLTIRDSQQTTGGGPFGLQGDIKQNQMKTVLFCPAAPSVAIIFAWASLVGAGAILGFMKWDLLAIRDYGR